MSSRSSMTPQRQASTARPGGGGVSRAGGASFGTRCVAVGTARPLGASMAGHRQLMALPLGRSQHPRQAALAELAAAASPRCACPVRIALAQEARCDGGRVVPSRSTDPAERIERRGHYPFACGGAAFAQRSLFATVVRANNGFTLSRFGHLHSAEGDRCHRARPPHGTHTACGTVGICITSV
jgi:hypothetical protein